MLKKYLKSDFVRNIFILISSSGISQLIPFLVLPFLQKYFYSPEDFGILSIYVSLSLMLVKFSTLSYEFAIVKQKTEKEALGILSGSVRVLFLTTIIISIGLLALHFFFDKNFYVLNLEEKLFLIPITILCFGSYQILRYWFNWKNKYKSIGNSMIAKSFAAELTKLILGILKFSGLGLVLGRIIGEIVSFFYLGINFLKHDFHKLKEINYSYVKTILKLNYKFPLYTMPSGLKGTLVSLIFISLFAKYFSVEKAGIIGVSVSYIGAGFGIISQSFAQVFYKKIHEIEGIELFKMLKKNVLLLFAIAFTIVLIIQLIPNSIVISLLGEQWKQFMPVLKKLIFAFSIAFISSSVSFIFIRMNRQKEMLIVDIFHLILITASIILGNYYTQDFILTLYFYIAAQIIYYCFTIFLAFYFVKKSIR